MVLRKALLKGMRNQMISDGIIIPGCLGMQARTDDIVMAVDNDLPPGCSGKYRDDITGQYLKDDLVAAARAVELQYFHEKGVWTKRPKAECMQRTGRVPITVRWVDVNKGDDESQVSFPSRCQTIQGS